LKVAPRDEDADEPPIPRLTIRRSFTGAGSPHPQKSASFFPCVSTQARKIPRWCLWSSGATSVMTTPEGVMTGWK
jgi:hypothetical protein